MRQAVAQTDAVQCLRSLRFVRDAVKILRQHHVFQRGEIRHKMELLEDKADFFRAVAHQLVFGQLREVDIIDDNAPGSQRIEAA